MNRLAFIALLALAVVAHVGLGTANLYLGDLNQDEGWYLYTASEVASGRIPYRDFAFTQGPVMPGVYALAHRLVEARGVAGGRLFTGLLGAITLLLSGALASRIAPRGGRLLAFVLTLILVGVNVYHSYFTVVVKTYSLCGLLLVTGLLLLSWYRRSWGAVFCFLGGVFLALAAGVRLSAGGVLPVVGFFLLMRRNRIGQAQWISFAVGGGVTLAVLFLPFLVLAREGFLFGMIEYHSHRAPGSWLSMAAYKVGFLSRWVQAYFVTFLAGVGWVVFRKTKGSVPASSDDRFPSLLWIAVLVVTGIHLVAPFPYDDYQVFLMPILGAAIAAAWARALMVTDAVEDMEPVARLDRRWALGLSCFLFLAATGAALSSPLNQDWFVSGRDRIWWNLKTATPLSQLRRAADIVKENSTDDSLLLTQDTYLAVESGRRVPEGLEMGPFSYYPEMDRSRAERLRVMNHERMVELLQTTEAPVAAFSGYGLSIASPGVVRLDEAQHKQLWELLRERYEDVDIVDPFGQAHTHLHILKLNPADEEPAS